MTKPKITSIAKISIDEFGFCRIHMDSSRQDEFGIDEANEMCEAAYEICKGKKHKHLIDMRNFHGVVEPGTREALRNNEKLIAVRAAGVMVVSNLAHKLIGNFFMRFNRPPYPYNVFSDYDEAVKWLQSIQVSDKIYSN